MPYKFINIPSEEYKPYTAVENIEMTVNDDASLTEILEAFEGFLKASGYMVDGKLDIVPEDEY
jgi:hypothetical protein